MKRLGLLLLLALPLHAAPIKWVAWSDGVFAQAKREHRFVLLDLEAVWCHWCHVMDEMTYADPKVQTLIADRYIAVRVDQDSRPDLSNRYEDFGWPATIVFNADGGEIVKRSGYLPPAEMSSMLQAIIDDPSPGPSVVPEPVPHFGASQIPDALRKQLEARHRETYDAKHGGWGFSHKYLDVPSVEYALERDDDENRRMARQTLDGERNLLDPVWGGVYQYSTGGVWSEPHFEKIMSMQTGNLRVAALAYAKWGDRRDLATAQAIRRYLVTFLRAPDGAFYTSQDADLVDGEHAGEYFKLDDAHRRAKGVPRVDKHRYARENGWAIEALATLAMASGDATALDDALRAAKWVYANLRRGDGGFNHDDGDSVRQNARDVDSRPLRLGQPTLPAVPAGPFLGDTLAMGRASLALYTATGDRLWLRRAEEAANYVEKTFAARPGYLTAKPAPMMPPKRQRDENVDVARFANLLFHYDSNPRYERMAKNAMRYLAAPEVAKPWPVGEILLAVLEMRRPPLHVTVVGSKRDPNARVLFTAAGAIGTEFKQIEWLDRSEGPLPNAKIEYPPLKRAAAFLCTENRCSLPLYTAGELSRKLSAWRTAVP